MDEPNNEALVQVLIEKGGLSKERAESVVNYLVEKCGIDRSRLSAKGYGATRRIAYNNTAEGRQKNRRINAIIDCVIEK